MGASALRPVNGRRSAPASACGVDGIAIARFEKDSESRLLAVKEQFNPNYANGLFES